MISGSLGGKDTGESPIEGSGGGARGELSSANCGIALYDSMPAPLTQAWQACARTLKLTETCTHTHTHTHTHT